MLARILYAIQELPAFRELIEAVQAGTDLPNLTLPRAARLPVLSALHKTLQAPILFLTHRADHALTLSDELNLWAPDSPQLPFPEPNPLFYENTPWGANTRRDRLIVLTKLAIPQIPGIQPPTSNIQNPISNPHPPIILAPARAVMTRTMPRRDFIKATQKLKPGQATNLDDLARHWVSLGYEVVNTVTAPGQFARRGGILDVWPPADTFPTRLEFFGDEIDTLRHFDPATQRTTGQNDLLLIHPAREFLQPPISNIQYPLSEFHIPLLYPHPGRIFDYLPRNALVVVDDIEAFRETVLSIEEQSLSLRKDYIEEGILAEDYPVPYLTSDQIEDSLPPGRALFFGPATASEDTAPPLVKSFTPNPRFGGRLKPLMEQLARTITRGETVIVVSRQSGRLEELWDENYRPTSGVGNEPTFMYGSLAEGWALTTADETTLYLFTDGEIFGWQPPKPRRRYRPVAEAPEAEYADLQPGDWVVHIDHGVGRFIGLVQRAIEGAEREYLCVEYAERDRLFVPVQQADRLTRYIGPDSRLPTPTRLGGPQWTTIKVRVKEAVEDMAEELLDLYAQRQVVTGYAFSADAPWQRELEASFPYIETEDQLRVLRDVKADMEASRPMDRLICGDVGFGKTEIALRAAFKAVMGGKQVAMLTPTTVLAQQHFHTFRQRLAAFPVEVEMLSRFRSPQEQNDILFRLAKGAVDIVIGTHRLISSDVEFKDLGLLIIDEEQRFGVTHKETIKQMRTEVDVLTLTATPIPRTLYLAMTGLRDISTLDTPPEERLPIITHVGPYSPQLIRRAILRELERGGQVFFVHNRVQTIGAIKSQLTRLVPEARIAIAHGQMPEAELAQRMNEFNDAQIDVLLATSIIESGLDIPNANTLIVDRADAFGLAQLYQLRGRVGRGAQRAYAYFFKHQEWTPTPEASQRLETIAENVQLGAGFNVAMRDLEIRGAGDILGTRQHGYIASVGFHLYTRLLAEAVKVKRENRGLPLDANDLMSKVHRPLVSVDLPLDTTIPSHYVPDLDMRLTLYRRIADAQTLEEVDALAEEFQDRFGLLPQPVKNLLIQLKIKILAIAAGVRSISHEYGQIVLRFPEGVEPPRATATNANLRAGKSALWVESNAQIEDQPELLVSLLEELISSTSFFQ
ncbi:MAG: transcription-repair coupling factor [Chloroflexi bacterium]|nr:transcription-repair coupling factor [Chloroflexota bacterium]